MATIEEILVAQGRSAADFRRQRGATYGDLYRGLGALPAQIQADQRDSRERSYLDRLNQQQLEMNDVKLRSGRDEQARSEAKAANDRRLSQIVAQSVDDNFNFDSRRAQALMTEYDAGDLAPVLMEIAGKWNADAARAEIERQRQATASRVTYGAPQMFIVKGRPTMGRAGSDGKIYDAMGTPIEDQDISIPQELRRGAVSDYSGALDRYARAHGKSVEDLSWNEELEARRLYSQAGSARPAGGRSTDGGSGASRGLPIDVRTHLEDLRANGLNRMEANEDIWRKSFLGFRRQFPNLSMSDVQAEINRLFPADGSRLEPGAAPSSVEAPAAGTMPGRGRSATPADVRAVAQRLGISEADARQQLEALGVSVQ